MRSLAFTSTGAAHFNEWAAMCCSCGLCTLFACPEELYPKEACDQSKAEMRKANQKYAGPTTVKPHPLRDGRRTPIKALMKKLNIGQYDHPAHWEPTAVKPARVSLPLKQSAGAPSQPLVRAGETVAAGQAVGGIPDKSLGAMIHAPFAATVAEVTATHIILNRS